jgi:MFS transporter, OPA family, sugar phosphate sensor protein UhpC
MFHYFARGADQPLLQDKELIDRLYRKKRFSLMMSITLGYAFYYTCRLGLSIVKKPLIDGNIFTPDDLGVIGSATFYGYALGKLINGFLTDHTNIKRFLPVGLLVSAVINMTMGFSPYLWLWVFLWGLNGWFQGFGAPASIVGLANWFSNNERGRYYGIWNASHSIGETLTFVIVAALVSAWSWHAGFIVPGIFCILVAVILFFTLQDRPQTYGLPSVAEWRNDHVPSTLAHEKSGDSVAKLQLSILKMPAIWAVGCASACMYVSRYAINSWGVLYLQEARGFSLVEAGSIMGVNTVAGIFGCIAFGFISDKLFQARRPPVNIIYGVLEVLALITIFYAPWKNTLLLTAAFAVYGFTLSGLMASLGGLFAVDIAPKRITGAAMGFVGIFSYLGAASQERVSGYLINRGITLMQGVRHYDFSHAVLFWCGASVVSLIISASLWRVKVND